MRFSFWALFAAMCAVVVRGYRQAEDADHRRRVRWVVFGSVCGLSPLALDPATELLVPLVGDTDTVALVPWTAMFHSANACVVTLPASLAYAVAKHRVLGVSVVMRRSLHNLLAKRVLQFLLLLPLIALLLPLAGNPNQPLREIFRVGAPTPICS